jgi:hypothetical protein
MATPVYEQLAFDITVPNTRVWVAIHTEYGSFWDQEDRFEDIYFDGDNYVEWVEDEAGNVIWGERSTTHSWGKRHEWFGTTMSLHEKRKDYPGRWLMDKAIEDGNIAEIKRLWME